MCTWQRETDTDGTWYGISVSCVVHTIKNLFSAELFMTKVIALYYIVVNTLCIAHAKAF